MITLSQDQMDDLRELQEHCAQLSTEFVIIGAIAYQYNFPDEGRHTGDIDIALALDLPDFGEMDKRLKAGGWIRDPRREHRRRSRRGSFVDLLPAGHELRKAGHITWPESGFTMSLVGFNHVFSEALEVEVAPQLIVKVVPAPVLMLLKIVAFMDDHYRREKDLSDIRSVLALYQADDERVYSDAVLEARLEDIDLASAYLIGWDLGSLCTMEELAVVNRFIAAVSAGGGAAPAMFVRAATRASRRNEHSGQAEILAFTKGLKYGKS
jgi:predicted nucleotidyltransferase